MAAAVIAYVQNPSKYLDNQKGLLGPELFKGSLTSIIGSITMQIQTISRLQPEDATVRNHAILVPPPPAPVAKALHKSGRT